MERSFTVVIPLLGYFYKTENVNITVVTLFCLLRYPKQKCIELALFLLLTERGGAI